MTEYGRGSGSEPWHPEDPLYGDDGWGGQQAQGAQSPYGGHPQQYPQQPQQHHYGDWGGGQPGAYDQNQQHYQQYPEHYPGQGAHPHQQPGPDPYQHGQYPYQQQGQQYPDPQQGQQYPDPQQGQQYPAQMQQGQGNGGWDSGGQGHGPYPGDPADPYGAQAGSHSGGQPDFHQTPDAYPPPESPHRRRAEPEPETDWDPGPDQGEHAFFAGGDDDDDGDDEPVGRRGRGRPERRGRGGEGKKRRSGCACLVVTLVLVGGVGGVGYFGYQFYQSRFGPAPDYTGGGTGEMVTVTIPKDSGGYAIGNALKEAGVVKSVDAFVAAQEQNPEGKSIQAGTYTLKKQMSAASAVQLMLDPKSRNNLIIAEGWRNAKIYTAIDERLKLKAGTTKDIAKTKWSTLGLPGWANTDKDILDPLEGFLYPSSYPVSKGMKPEAVLKQMVDLAKEKYNEYGIKDKADSLNLKNPLQVLTVASLVQAEGKSKRDFEKVATVVYNRLKPDNTETYGLLDFDSTVNYLRGESKLATGSVDQLRKIHNPYNTYWIKGLPPGPIGNPGEVAIKAALHPAKGNWYYFVSVSEDKTLFAETNAEQNRNREKYLEEQKKGQ